MIVAILPNSVPLLDFSTIKGSSNINYSTIDEKANQAISYYRLKMVDLDGTFNYSKIISINKEVNNTFVNVQNPAIEGAFILRTNAELKDMNIVNTIGNTVGYTIQNIGVGEYKIQLKQPVSGVYILVLPFANQTSSKVLVP